MIFWTLANPLIWRLGKRSKWVRMTYYHLRKGKWLWGFMRAIQDDAICRYYTPPMVNADYPEFEKHIEQIFKYKNPK